MQITSWLIIFFSLFICPFSSNAEQRIELRKDFNGSKIKEDILRVIKPGVFDYQSSRFIVRMRAWGVGFPKRDQPGYTEALSFTERSLLSTTPKIKVRQEFDIENLKVVEIFTTNSNLDFSREAISKGIGWHIEKETNRYGPFVLSQLKAKRMNLGIWASNFNFQQIKSPLSMPIPKLPGMVSPNNSFVPTLSFWVTSFGKIHRPGCSFYQRGRGILSTKPEGVDCRICGGRNSK